MSILGCADVVAAKERSDRELSPTPSTDTQTGNSKGARSVARKRRSSPKLLATGKWLVDCNRVLSSSIC